MSTPRGGGADRVPGSEIEGPKRVCKFAGFCRFQPVAIGPICKHTTSRLLKNSDDAGIGV
jgi:hypothetical protein